VAWRSLLVVLATQKMSLCPIDTWRKKPTKASMEKVAKFFRGGDLEGIIHLMKWLQTYILF